MVIKAKTACSKTSIICQIMVGIFSIGVHFRLVTYIVHFIVGWKARPRKCISYGKLTEKSKNASTVSK